MTTNPNPPLTQQQILARIQNLQLARSQAASQPEQVRLTTQISRLFNLYQVARRETDR